MADETSAVATQADLEKLKGELQLGALADVTFAGGQGVQLKTMADLFRYATAVAQSGQCPSGMKTPQQVMVAMQSGAELGFSPMRALAVGHVIDGKYGLDGSVAKALVRTRGGLKKGTDFEEWVENEDDPDWEKWVGVCRAWPAGLDKSVESRFSYGDAVMAGLWTRTEKDPTGKDAWKILVAPWWKYPKRMLKARARGYLLTDHFSHITQGIQTLEELEDMARVERDVTPVVMGEDPPEAVGSLLAGVVEAKDAEVVGPYIAPEARTELQEQATKAVSEMVETVTGLKEGEPFEVPGEEPAEEIPEAEVVPELEPIDPAALQTIGPDVEVASPGALPVRGGAVDNPDEPTLEVACAACGLVWLQVIGTTVRCAGCKRALFVDDAERVWHMGLDVAKAAPSNEEPELGFTDTRSAGPYNERS